MKTRIIALLFLAAILSLPAYAHFAQESQPHAVFQSTSAMQLSGSAYSAVPALNPDGTPMYYAEQASTNGVFRLAPVTPQGDPINSNPSPVGDAVLPLLLMAAAFALRKQYGLKS